MRPIELTLSIVTIFSAFLYFLPAVTARIRSRVVPVVLVLAVAAQIGLEGFRWQLWPLAVAILLLLLAGWMHLRAAGSPRSYRGLAAASLLLATLSLAIGWLAPIPRPYPITGPYQVGTITFPLQDTSRKEIYGPNPNDWRENMVQVWYPASPTPANSQAQWMPDIEEAGPAVADWIGLPSFTLNHLKYVQANAFVDAPMVAGSDKLPLLIFSHGWSGFKEQNIYQVEEMASHGYVVVGINHTYGAVLTVFPDGRQMRRNDAALPDDVSQEEYDRASNRLVRQWAADIGFVLDEFARRDQAGENWQLAGRLDFSKVGIFGHSTGGGATAEFCGVDARCKAALMMDLWVEPVSDVVVSSGLTQPILLMHSAAWADLDDPGRNFLRVGELVRTSAGEVIEFRIEGTEHHDFSSLPLLTPIASGIGLKGPIPGERVLALVNDYTLSFFDRYLLGIEREMLEPENTPYPEVQFDLRK